VKEAAIGDSGTFTSIKETELAAYDCFLDSVMPRDKMSADVASMKSLTGQPCIINVNEATMGHEYINTSSLAESLGEINGAIDRPASYRFKPVVMVVLGSGGGKTRLLEECRRALNQDDCTLAIAITNNAHSCYDVDSEIFVPGDKNLPLNFALSVLLRVMCVVYKYDFEQSMKVIRANIGKLELGHLLESLVKFIRAFMSRAIRAVDARCRAADSKQRPLARVVLMMDEVMRMKDDARSSLTAPETDATRIANVSMLVRNGFSRFISAMNRALLDEEFHGPEGNIVRAALVISSLEFPLHDLTIPSRAIRVITTPDLAPEEVVSRWWLRGVDNAPGPGTATFEQLKRIASTMVGVPRLLQFAQEYIFANQSHFNGSNPVLRPEVVRDLFAYVFSEASSSFILSQDVVCMDEKIFALIYQDETTLDRASMSLIRASYFSRHPRRFPAVDVTVKFVPNGSIAMLAAYDVCMSSIVHRELFTNRALDIGNDKLLFYNTLVSILNAINAKAAEGRALEEAVESWLVARLVSARKAGRSSISLYKLLGLYKSMYGITAPDINISTPVFEGCVAKVLPFPPISKDPVKYAYLFNKSVMVSESNPCMLYKSAALQSYDTMVVSESGGAVHVLFIDMKSEAINTATSMDDDQTYVLDTPQYDQIQEVVDALKTIDPSQLSKASRALIAGNYTYVYMTTHPSVEIKRGDDIVVQYPSNLIVMTESNTKAFMGMLWDVYASARTLLHAK
jgi:hypothetical protein